MHSRHFAAVLTLLACSMPSGRAPVADDRVPPNDGAIADVQAGRVETAKAIWWGFDPADATRIVPSSP